MKYIVQTNDEDKRIEVIVLTRKGNLETTISGDDTLFFKLHGRLFTASEFYALVSDKLLSDPLTTTHDESISGNDPDAAPQSEQEA